MIRTTPCSACSIILDRPWVLYQERERGGSATRAASNFKFSKRYETILFTLTTQSQTRTVGCWEHKIWYQALSIQAESIEVVAFGVRLWVTLQTRSS